MLTNAPCLLAAQNRGQGGNPKMTCNRQPLKNNTWHISVIGLLSAELEQFHKSAVTF